MKKLIRSLGGASLAVLVLVGAVAAAGPRSGPAGDQVRDRDAIPAILGLGRDLRPARRSWRCTQCAPMLTNRPIVTGVGRAGQSRMDRFRPRPSPFATALRRPGDGTGVTVAVVDSSCGGSHPPRSSLGAVLPQGALPERIPPGHLPKRHACRSGRSSTRHSSRIRSLWERPTVHSPPSTVHRPLPAARRSPSTVHRPTGPHEATPSLAPRSRKPPTARQVNLSLSSRSEATFAAFHDLVDRAYFANTPTQPVAIDRANASIQRTSAQGTDDFEVHTGGA